MWRALSVKGDAERSNISVHDVAAAVNSTQSPLQNTFTVRRRLSQDRNSDFIYGGFH